MNDVLRLIAARQAGCFASWQLRRAGLSWNAIRHRTRGLRRLHDGVFLTGDAPVTRLQRWWAATLTSPSSVLAFASAGAAHEIRPWEGAFEVIVRGGVRRSTTRRRPPRLSHEAPPRHDSPRSSDHHPRTHAR